MASDKLARVVQVNKMVFIFFCAWGADFNSRDEDGVAAVTFTDGHHGRVMPRVFSNSAEKTERQPVIFLGCSASVVNMRSAVSGL